MLTYLFYELLTEAPLLLPLMLVWKTGVCVNIDIQVLFYHSLLI